MRGRDSPLGRGKPLRFFLNHGKRERIISCAEKIIEMYHQEIGMEVQVCFSLPGKTLAMLPEMYHRFLLLERYSYYIGEENIIGYGYNCREEEFDQLELLNLTREVEKEIEEGLALQRSGWMLF